MPPTPPIRVGAMVACAGALALASVAGWRLRASYAADLETICAAEARSGLPLRGDMSATAEWTRDRLATPEGNRFYSALLDLPVARRGARLGAEAAAHSLASCPMVAAYEGLVEDALFRAEMQRLCSRATFPDLASLAAGDRAAALEAWIETQASTPRMRALAPALGTAVTQDDRVRALRTAARSVDVFTCDIAAVVVALDPLDAGGE